MTTNSTEIKAAVDLMGPEDFDAGVPKLEVVRRIAGDETITADDVKAALPGEGTVTKPAADSAKVETVVLADISANGDADNTGAMHTPDPNDKPDEPTKDVDPNDVKRAKATEAQAELREVQGVIDQLQQQRTLILDALAGQEKRKVELETVIEENTVQFSDAEMVKRIQQQTQERLQRQAEARAKVAGVMNTAGVRTFASPLDQALANGAKRTKVLGTDGKVFEAPHPRSPEGVRAYAGWVHGGQKQPA